MMPARILLGAALAAAIGLWGCTSLAQSSADPPSPSVVPTSSSAAPSRPPLEALGADLLRQLGLGPAQGIVLSADPTEIPVPKPGQYLSGLSDVRLSNRTTRPTWITPNETAYVWRESVWERIGCGEGSTSAAEDWFGFCDADLIANELPAGAAWTGDSEPVSFAITWPGASASPVGPGFYAFVLPVWDSEIAAEREAPRTAAVLVVELVDP
jgi:hypothetical protein